MSTATLAVVVTLALAGCGGATGGGADDRTVRETVGQWISAVARHDGPAACALLSTRLQRAIERHLLGEGVEGSCRTWAARWVSPRHAASRRDARVTAVRIRGDRATVRLAAPGAVDAHAKLTREHGHWRIDDF
jgi:hypothetical protein